MLDRYITKRGAMGRLLKTKELARWRGSLNVRLRGQVFGIGQAHHAASGGFSARDFEFPLTNSRDGII